MGKFKEMRPSKDFLIKGGKLRVIPKTGMIARHEKSV